MKHGIHIREHKRWNTKTVYNQGHVMRIYRRQPKAVGFESPMVNDFNQHLCGGWFMPGLDTRESILQRLVDGLKPFGTEVYYQDEKAAAERDLERLLAAGLKAELRRRAHATYRRGSYVWDLLAAQDMRVREIGDMGALAADYGPVLGPDCARQLSAYADWRLARFFDGWDTPDLPTWLTGLILGYPIENTISLYLWG